MKIKLDENLPDDLAAPLRLQGHDVHTVFEEGLGGSADPDIQAASAAEGRFLITQDVKFADRRKWRIAPASGIMLVRVVNDQSEHLIRTVLGAFQREDVDARPGKHVTVTENKVRVRSLSVHD